MPKDYLREAEEPKRKQLPEILVDPDTGAIKSPAVWALPNAEIKHSFGFA